MVIRPRKFSADTRNGLVYIEFVGQLLVRLLLTVEPTRGAR